MEPINAVTPCHEYQHGWQSANIRRSSAKQHDARPRTGLWQLNGWIWWHAWIPALIAIVEHDVWLVIATYGNEYGRKLHGPAVDGWPANGRYAAAAAKYVRLDEYAGSAAVKLTVEAGEWVRLHVIMINNRPDRLR